MSVTHIDRGEAWKAVSTVTIFGDAVHVNPLTFRDYFVLVNFSSMPRSSSIVKEHVFFTLCKALQHVNSRLMYPLSIHMLYTSLPITETPDSWGSR